MVIALSAFIMSGCKTIEVVPLELPEEYQPVDFISVTYIAPKNYFNTNEGINGMTFLSYIHGRWDAKEQQKLYLTPINHSSFLVHRRTHNGIAGSGIMYNVNYTSKVEGDTVILNFKPYESKSYQEGLVFPFPLPNFNIELYLLQPIIKHPFEVNSNYSAESIKSNFDRLLPKNHKKPYHIVSKAYEAYVSVKMVPYRNGSKVLSISNIIIKPNNGNKVNLVNIIKDLESKIRAIVND